MAAPLALGTVQFGLAYGITHAGGPVSPETQRAILDRAARSGITLIDTAAGYGQSEAALGRILPTMPPPAFAIVTKTWPIRTDRLTSDDLDRIVARFRASLAALNVDAVDTLLVHDSRDLMAEGGDHLWQQMEQWRREGSVRHLGVSVYSGAEAEAVRARYPVERVQLPLNLLDQRAMADGSLERLAGAGVGIHVRSAYLQGLLLTDPAALPGRLAALAPRIAGARERAEALGLSPSALALGFVASRPGVSAVVVGVQSDDQLAEAILAHREGAAALERGGAALDLTALACDDPVLIDPRRW